MQFLLKILFMHFFFLCVSKDSLNLCNLFPEILYKYSGSNYSHPLYFQHKKKMGSIFSCLSGIASSVAALISSIVSAIAGFFQAIISGITSCIVGIFNALAALLTCRCCGGGRRRTV